ncbi:MAG: hypothetical protein AB7U73_23030 [Pirellulales bacterium]
MQRHPDFFLTAAGEYRSLAEPRSCFVKRYLRDVLNSVYVEVEIHPPFSPIDEPETLISSLLLLARHHGESIDTIRSWPFVVYVCRALDGDSGSFNKHDLQLIAWARLYPDIEGATKDANQHSSPSQAIRAPETINAQLVRFVGEQDGIPERTLKQRLESCLSHDERIWKAFLARVDCGPDTPIRVALCLRTVMGPDDAIVANVGKVFAALFHTRESLDILFIDDRQERELSSVCKPFYVRVISRRM